MVRITLARLLVVGLLSDVEGAEKIAHPFERCRRCKCSLGAARNQAVAPKRCSSEFGSQKMAWRGFGFGHECRRFRGKDRLSVTKVQPLCTLKQLQVCVQSNP